MDDAMDVHRGEVEHVAGDVAPDLRLSAQAQALLDDRPLRDDHGARGEIVVMEAGVVPGHPADQPDLDLVVDAQAREDALLGVVADQVLPGLRVGGKPGDQLAQLGAFEGRGRGQVLMDVRAR